MLLGNGVLTNKLPLMYYGGVQCNTNWNRDEIILGLGSFDLKASAPEGYGIIGYEKAIKAGGGSSLVLCKSTVTADGCLGVDSDGSAIGIVTVTGEGSLIVSGEGSAISTVSVTGEGTLIIAGSGSAIGTSTAYSTMVFAYGYASASCASFTACTLDAYAVAHGSGTTVDTSGLTPASIWSYGDRTLTGAGGLSTAQQAQLDIIEINTGNIATLM